MIRLAFALCCMTLPAAAQVVPGSVPRPVTPAGADVLRVAIAACWNVGALTADGMQTRVTVAVMLDSAAVPVPESIRLIGHVGPSPDEAYQSARRAILRCGVRGFPLPPEKQNDWRNLELNFDPAGLLLR